MPREFSHEHGSHVQSPRGAGEFVVGLRGGLGNQLFQLAFGLALADRHNVNLLLDASRFRNSVRDFSLSPFGFAGSEFAWTETRLSRLVRRARPAVVASRAPRLVRERQLKFDQRLLRVRPNAYVTGYFLSYRYWYECPGVLQRVAGVLPPPDPDVAGIHVRRGDFVSLDQSVLLTPTYYKQAAARLKSLTGVGAFRVFSDDVEWAQNNLDLGGCEVDFVAGGTEFSDFSGLAGCGHIITSRSTYSLWAAYLGSGRVGGCVIVPANWLARLTPRAREERLDDDLYPDHFHRMET